MKISIIIPVYNVGIYIRQSLDSVVNQTYANLDIVCVDDGSTDDSLRIIEEYASVDSRFQIIKQANCGTVIARQKAVETAIGDYILFLDPDDWLELNACEKLLAFALEKQADVIQYGIIAEGVKDLKDKENIENCFVSLFPQITGTESLMEGCFAKKLFPWNLIGKMVVSHIAKIAFDKQDPVCFAHSTDIYASYFLYCHANSLFDFKHSKLYHYRYGCGVSTQKNLPIERFEKALRQFDGLDSIKSYAEANYKDGDVRKNIIIRFIKPLMVNACLEFGINRIDKKIDVSIWAKELAERIGDKETMLYAIMSAINKQQVMTAVCNQNRALETILDDKRQQLLEIKKQKFILELQNHNYKKRMAVQRNLLESQKKSSHVFIRKLKNLYRSLSKNGNRIKRVDFSNERYLTAYPDAQPNAAVHFWNIGRIEERFCYTTGDMGVKKVQQSCESPFISVIVTSYNYERYISETLDSLVNQSYKNFEVIVIDDGSEDNSLEVIKSYQKQYDFIHLFTHYNNVNQGIIKSIQLGIEKSKGSYIAICESDDYWHNNYLEKKIDIINKYENVVIISNAIEMFGNQDHIKQRGWVCQHIRKLLKQGGTPIDLRYNQEFNFIPTLSSVMIRKDVLELLDFNSPVPAWIDFWIYRQILSLFPLYFVDKTLTFWRQHDSFNSLTNSSQIANRLPEFLKKSNKLIGLGT